MHKQSSSEAAWALLTEGVTSARLEIHRLKHLVRRAEQLVAKSAQREHLYQVAGDIIVALPKRIQTAERVLDRTALALSVMGQEFLKARLPLSDKQQVEEAVESAFGGTKEVYSSKRVAQRYFHDKARRS